MRNNVSDYNTINSIASNVTAMMIVTRSVRMLPSDLILDSEPNRSIFDIGPPAIR